MLENIVILSAQRTPIGAFNGVLSSLSAPQLGSIAIKAALEKAQIKADQVDEVIMGNVLTAGVGQAPARQASIGAGIPTSAACLTINKVCGSGLKAIMLAADSLQLGNAKIVVAGGQESMSRAPHLLENSRNGYRMGHIQTSDSMIKDGLWDPYSNIHMGIAGELCVKENNFTREQQDQFAIESYQYALKAQENNSFANEIVAVPVSQGKETKLISKDEDPEKVKFDKIPSLKPSFDKEGSITAANASKISDGAAALVLTTESNAKALQLKPMAKILASATFSQDPKYFTTAPAGAIQKALDKAKLKAGEIDLWEINEAFAVVSMYAMREFKIPREKINVFGGACSLGHPIGASGARITATLLNALKTKNKKYGLATLCIGGGEAVAVVFENLV